MEPLASKYRPQTISDFIGQDHLIGESGPLKIFIEQGKIPSMIFWGPPGTGKTTLASIIASSLDYDFHKIQAVNMGKERLTNIIKTVDSNSMFKKNIVLFIDEIHRWNKAQQDALLPYVENGTVTLIGATTENPSFTVINALLSRAKVFVFKQHNEEDIYKFILKISEKEFPKLKVRNDALKLIASISNGDLRSAINTLEISSGLAQESKDLTIEVVEKASQRQIYHDRDGDNHFDIISAVHKSMRSSDADAASYWVTRMIEGGDDPLYIARRLLRFASEDVGNADPHAVVLANAVFDTCHKIGLPECNVHLIQLARYLAHAPKDNTAYVVAQAAKKDVQEYGNLSVPLHLRNAPTKLMSDLGYSEGYIYDHDLPDKKSGQQCMPDKLKDRKYVTSK